LTGLYGSYGQLTALAQGAPPKIPTTIPLRYVMVVGIFSGEGKGGERWVGG